MLDPSNAIWTERYRPVKVDDVVGDFRDKIKKYLENPEALPNFLLHSKVPGTGKCITGDSIILTQNGMISFEQYCNDNNIVNEYTNKNELVFCGENNFVKTEYIYKSNDKVISIKTKHGHEIKGTKNHKIKIFDVKQGLIWKKLSEIKKDDIIPIFYNTNIFGNNNKFDYKIYNNIVKKKGDNSTIELTKKPKEINNDIAYLLGVLVANSVIKKDVRISTHKDWLQKKLMNIIKENFDINAKYDYDKRIKKVVGVNISRKKLTEFFIYVCGCSSNTAREKFIPKIILQSSKDIQMNFLNGLFEDSWIDKNAGNSINFSTASDRLAIEIEYMLLNLGLYNTHKTKYLDKYKHIYHNICINAEHSKVFIQYFNGYYKNEYINFCNNPNTNILTYNNKISEYVKNKRKQNNINRFNVKSLITQKQLRGSIYKVKNNLTIATTEEKYLNELKIFLEKDIILDCIENIKELDRQNIYDFHIPNTHSFLANGIINHNTTLAKCIINELGCDALILNSSDDRKIETVREKVKEFAITKSTKNNLRRCVFLDEFDGMLKASQEALRNVMETYSSNVFFILTCNNINKVIEPIKSRCVVIPFAYPSKEEIYSYVEKIVIKEKMNYSEDGLRKLVELNYPSIRNCVLALQDLYTVGNPVTEETVKPVNEIYEEMWEYLKQKRWLDIKKVIMESTIDPRDLNTFFWQKSLESEPANITLLQITCRNEKDISWGADARVVVVTSLIEMVK